MLAQQILGQHYLCKDTSGHGWNQSMTVELIVARKRWLRTLKFAPTGLAVNTTCKLLRTCSQVTSMRNNVWLSIA